MEKEKVRKYFKKGKGICSCRVFRVLSLSLSLSLSLPLPSLPFSPNIQTRKEEEEDCFFFLSIF
jgi:hypothetical protein